MKGLTENQIKWAAEHDWYIATSKDRDAVLVKEVVRDCNTGMVIRTQVWFKDFDDLRSWAGY